MSSSTGWHADLSPGSFVVPGTSFRCVPGLSPCGGAPGPHFGPPRQSRDPGWREIYLAAALADVPHLLSTAQADPAAPAHGCFDRAFWRYGLSGAASIQCQAAALPLAMLHVFPLPGNRWHHEPAAAELCEAAVRFAARRWGDAELFGRADAGPAERESAAAALAALAEACELMRFEGEPLDWLRSQGRRLVEAVARWPQGAVRAPAALALSRLARATGEASFAAASEACALSALRHQGEDGAFGDPGDAAGAARQALTVASLSLCIAADAEERCGPPLARAARRLRALLRPGEPPAALLGEGPGFCLLSGAMERLARSSFDAAEVADALLRDLDPVRRSSVVEDLLGLRIAGLIHAYLAWSPSTPCEAMPAVDSLGR
jgi:hypothetical protein